MPNHFYVIIGPLDGDQQQYWNIDTWDWTPEFDEATRFDERILASPIPEGTEGIMKINDNLEPMQWFEAQQLPSLPSPL